MIRSSFIILVFLWILSSCVGRRYLREGEKILVDQRLEGTEGISKDELTDLYEYTPNDRVLFLPWSPYVGLYQLGQRYYDSTKYLNKIEAIQSKYEQKSSTASSKKANKLKKKLNKKVAKLNRNLREGNLAMRMGEPLAVYDSTKEQQTVNKILEYLNAKGYFEAQVSHRTDEAFELVTSFYTIDKKGASSIDSVFYEIPNDQIRSLLKSDEENSLIKARQNYEQQNLVAERDRINNLLQDNGYHNFSRQFISFAVDTTSLGPKKILVGIYVKDPPNDSEHRRYHVDSINFITDAGVRHQSGKRNHKLYNGVTYQFYDRKYSEKILNWRIFIESDSLYSRSNTLETQRQLSNMDIFKFVNVNYDTVGGEFVTNIYASALQKYQTSSELGLNVSNGLPGPFFNASIKNRNTFGGLEIMELSGRIGFEGLSGASETDNPYSSLDYGSNLAFTFPQFWFPFGEEARIRFGHLNPRTRISLGINFNYRLEYQRNTLNGSMRYSWFKNKSNSTHNLALIDANYINSDITDQDFQDFLEARFAEGNNLINSFNSAFVTSTWYGVSYNKNDYGNMKSNSGFFRYRIETGGNWNSLYDQLAEKDSIELYRFAKFNVDFRRHYPINRETAVALRINTGIAVPYGDNETLPYEKFYFAGGSNSIRAWEPRRLGPGSFLPIDSLGQYNNDFEQPGEIIFEAGVELRHRLFGFMKGAIFIDAGNVWTIEEDPSRPGSEFRPRDFINEVAVGAGYGIRFDLSFLLLRLDAAWKIIEPGRRNSEGVDERSTFSLPELSHYNRLVWNLGIGFPF